MHSEDDKALQEKNKKRIVKTRAQVEALEKFYNEYKYPTEAMKLQVADSICLTEKRVSSWFCHRRLKDKMLFDYENYTTAGKQDRSSGVIQDRGSGYREDSCSSTEQGDDLTMDTREVESDRTGSYDRTDSDDPFDPVNSRYSVPKFNAGGEKTRAGPSGYLKVKGQVDSDLLHSGVSESSTEEPEEVKGKEKYAPNEKRPPRHSSKEVNSSDEARPSKKSRKSSSSDLPHTIATPNHSFFNKSVLNNTDATTAIQYLQAICPTADRNYLDTLSVEEFTNEYALHFSKYLVYQAHYFAQATNRCNDPKLAAELKTTEGLVASLRSQMYMQGVCPTADDRKFLNTLSDEEFTKEYALHASKFIVYLAYSFARARNGENDPKYALHASKFIVYLAHSVVRVWNEYNDIKVAAELKTTEGKVEAKSKAQELETKSKEIEEMASRLSDLKAQEVEKVQAAHEEGVLAGRAGYLRSEEGLMMVDRIREVNRESVLHSGDFCRAVVDVTKFYGKYLLGKIKEWVANGNALEAFSVHETMKNAPDAPRLLLTEEHQRMERLGAKDLLDYLEAQDRAALHPDDNQQDAEEGEAATGTSKGAPDGDGQSS